MRIEKGKVTLERILTELDRLLLDFLRIVERHTKYAVVSGYVSIIFGRARGTEDIDIVVPKMSKDEFLLIYRELMRKGWWCINSENAEELHERYLMENIAVRFAKNGTVIPNIELRFAKDEIDDYVIKNPLTVHMKEGTIAVSPPEVQIPYKRIMLGSEKDGEDALHLEEIFKDALDKDKLRHWGEKMKRMRR